MSSGTILAGAIFHGLEYWSWTLKVRWLPLPRTGFLAVRSEANAEGTGPVLPYLAGAVLIHMGLVAFWTCVRSGDASVLPSRVEKAAWLTVETVPEPATSPPPPVTALGGGSPASVGASTVPARVAISGPKIKGITVPKGLAVRPDQAVKEVTQLPTKSDPPVPDGPPPWLREVAEKEQAADLAMRLRAVRTQTLAARPNPPDGVAVPGAPVSGGTDAQSGSSLGNGAGVNGGLGGKGVRGSRFAGTQRSVFGGTQGAFVGRVCALQKGTVALRRASGPCPTIAEVRTDQFDVSPRRFNHGFPGVTDRDEWFAIEYRGKFRVGSAGFYRFRLAADDGAILFVDGEQAIDHDGIHQPTSKLGVVVLTAGEHQMRLLYFQGPREMLALQLFVTPPGKAERLFGPKL